MFKTYAEHMTKGITSLRLLKELLGPTVHDIPSSAIEGPNVMFDGSLEYINCSNSKQARQLVNYFQEQGWTLIKTYNNIPRESFFILMEEAKLAGIDVAGHKPVRVNTIQAANSGMKSLEHAQFLLWDSFTGSKELWESDNRKRKDNTILRQRILDEHSTILLKENLESLKRNNTYYCPTYLTRKSDAFADNIEFRERYNDINPIFRFLSFEDLDATIQEDTTILGRQVYKDFYGKGLEVTNDYGVKILAGSDVPELPGTSLLDELQELSMAGFYNYDVLRAVTLTPSEYYSLDSKYGTVSNDKITDLILLFKNPIANITHLKNIDAVIRDGIYLNSDDLSSLQNKITSRNNSLLMSAKLIWGMLIYTTLLK